MKITKYILPILLTLTTCFAFGQGFVLSNPTSLPNGSFVQVQQIGGNTTGVALDSLINSTITTLSSTLAIGSALSMTTATPRNIDTLVLTAGTWLVSGNVNFSESAATTTEHVAGITTTSATIPTDGTQVYSNTQSVLLTGIDGITLPSKIVIVATGTTNVYLVGSTTFSAGTSAGFGSILAWKL